jgi:hypothetical protein
MKEKLKLSYADWLDDGKEFVFTKILEQSYDVEFTNPNQSDITFVSVFGNTKGNLNSFTIYYTVENTRNPMDVNYSMNYNQDSNFILPIYYVMSNEYTVLNKVESPLMLENRVGGKRNNFCGFLISNPSNYHRNNAFNQLSNKYKHVDSGGGALNNIGYRAGDTIKWMSNYKFYICFENTKYDYYITEKLINAYHAGCIPIYWGSDTVGYEFNENCMINANNMSLDEMIEKVKEIDNNDKLYKSMLSEPLLKNNIYDIRYTTENLLEKFSEIIKNRK